MDTGYAGRLDCDTCFCTCSTLYRKDITDDTDITEMYGFFAQLAVAITALIFICYKTGEKPKWMWGVPKKDEEEEKEK